MNPVCTLGVIPARLASTRLPRKVLREIAGRPMLAWVYDAALACAQLDSLVIATDSAEVAALCRHHGWPFAMTSPDLLSGSDRVHAVSLTHPAGIYVNIQGDEPLLRPEHIGALLTPFADSSVDVTTLKVRCAADDLHNPNAVKVVLADDGRALLFSRAPIPWDRDGAIDGLPGPQSHRHALRHIGMYAYRVRSLLRLAQLPPAALELREKLEQLRALANGMQIRVAIAALRPGVDVNTPADLERIRTLLETPATS